ncbi:uncharacterized protein LOC131684059 [Topomyia yanbarensis]|uniref:uncharacterized protein LOC131684059 n=1 Tax=Topomyia yanbarensis TaxID=2498891 RepID=UPI00273B0E06|nr:uncharacterized protein LOC131684059 [Topomyia yanbarensis]
MNQQPSQNDAGKERKAEWLSGSWPLQPFDDSLTNNKRKAEWIRFRDQCERIVSCKAPVDSITKLTGLKNFAGNYLLTIIEMQEKLVPGGSEDIYKATLTALNNYFNQTCDTTKERMKFRELQMKMTEPFSDWVLRLGTQAKFCDFGELQQREEEFIQALLRRSIPMISEKLYEISSIFNNNLEKIINHGNHLDFIRSEAQEATSTKVTGMLVKQQSR